jgi:hypothetical protein
MGLRTVVRLGQTRCFCRADRVGYLRPRYDKVGAYVAGTFERALADTEGGVSAALRGAATVTRELRKARVGAKNGQVREVRRAVAAAESAAAALLEAAQAVQSSFDLDEQDYLASGAYAKELLEAGSAAGLAMYEEDERILCYPSLVRVLPSDAAVEIDRKRERRLRPSVLVGLLAATQSSPPRFKPDGFLDSLRTAYDLVIARDGKKPHAVVRLDAVWALLTLLPGQGRDYTKQEFARDLYLLDQSGVTATDRDPRRLRWSASSGTRGAGVLTTVARSGQQQRYWGISFTEPAGEGGR